MADEIELDLTENLEETEEVEEEVIEEKMELGFLDYVSRAFDYDKNLNQYLSEHLGRNVPEYDEEGNDNHYDWLVKREIINGLISYSKKQLMDVRKKSKKRELKDLISYLEKEDVDFNNVGWMDIYHFLTTDTAKLNYIQYLAGEK